MANFFSKAALKREWGQTACLFLAFLGLLALMPRSVGEHFIFPTESFRWLAHGQNPYGVILPRCSGPFLYSPASAFFLFSFFSLFPEKLGELLYTALSAGLFLFALNFFIGTLNRRLGFDLSKNPLRHLAWLMVASELLGAILATKFEILLVAGGLSAFSALLQGRWVWAGIGFAAICNFKLQALPVVLLFSVPSLRNRQGLLFFLSFFLASLFWFFAPLPLLGSWNRFVVITLSWMAAIDAQVSGEWLKAVYQHFFGFLSALAVPMDLPLAKKIMGGVGTSLGLWLAFFTWRQPRGDRNYRESLLLALGLGCLYIVAFSPLSQSNAYIWYLPSIFCFLFFSARIGLPAAVQAGVLGGAYAIISIAYSDLVPRFVYRAIYNLRLKPAAAVGFLMVIAGVSWFAVRKEKTATALPS